MLTNSAVFGIRPRLVTAANWEQDIINIKITSGKSEDCILLKKFVLWGYVFCSADLHGYDVF